MTNPKVTDYDPYFIDYPERIRQIQMLMGKENINVYLCKNMPSKSFWD
jgi:hypothetical protein